MLVLSRKVEEQVVIGRTIGVTVVAIQGNKVRLGFTAPDEVPVYRKEISPLDGDMAELLLLVPTGQAAALATVARERGLTVGQMIRRLIRSFLRQPAHLGHGAGASEEGDAVSA